MVSAVKFSPHRRTDLRRSSATGSEADTFDDGLDTDGVLAVRVTFAFVGGVSEKDC